MSRTVPRDPRHEWPYGQGRSQGYGAGQNEPGSGDGDMGGASSQEYGDQWNGAQAYDGYAQGGQPYGGQPRNDQGGYHDPAYGGQDHAGYAGQQYAGQGQGYGDYGQGYGDQHYAGQAYYGQGYDGQTHNGQGYSGQADGAQGYGAQGYGDPAHGYQDPASQYQAYADHASTRYQGYADPAATQYQGYADPAATQYQDYADPAATQYEGYADPAATQYQGYADPAATQSDMYAHPGNGLGQGYDGQGYDGQATRQYDGYGDPRGGPGQDYQDQGYQEQGYPGQGYPDEGYPDEEYDGYGGRSRHGYREPGGDQPSFSPAGAGRGRRPGDSPQKKVRFRRLRRFSRRPSVRVIAGILAIFLVWVMFSAGQATFKNNGQGLAANFAEWARDHHLSPLVTFAEWMSYNPPKSGGEPTFAYTVPKGEQVTAPSAKSKHKGFVPDIPPTVKSLAAGPARPGEGQWRVVEKVKGEPALLITFLRDGGQYTSYSNGIASIDQRLVKFSLRPGTEDPGSAPGNGGSWGVPNYIPSGQRTGLLATFNGGFKLDSAGGGFYLNGMYHGSLVNGAASIVYYKNGTVKVGQWGRDFQMSSQIEGVRQNLKLLVDHGKVAANVNKNVIADFGATLGGGYWVWRSGIGITKDGRLIYVYGQALDAADLAELMQRAGVVEGMQMDINPSWMKFDYYQANGHPSDPTPTPLLPNQQPDPYSYYTPSTRDFTAVYAR